MSIRLIILICVDSRAHCPKPQNYRQILYPSSCPSHLQQLVLLTLPQSHVPVERQRNSLGLGAAPRAHAQLGQLVTHRAVERGEVLGDGSLPPNVLSNRGRGAGRLMDLCAETWGRVLTRCPSAFYCPPKGSESIRGRRLQIVHGMEPMVPL